MKKERSFFSHDFYDQTIVGIVMLMSQLCNSGILPLARKSDTPTNHKKQSLQKNKNKKRESISADRPPDLTYLLRRLESKGASSIAG